MCELPSRAVIAFEIWEGNSSNWRKPKVKFSHKSCLLIPVPPFSFPSTCLGKSCLSLACFPPEILYCYKCQTFEEQSYLLACKKSIIVCKLLGSEASLCLANCCLQLQIPVPAMGALWRDQDSHLAQNTALNKTRELGRRMVQMSSIHFWYSIMMLLTCS